MPHPVSFPEEYARALTAWPLRRLLNLLLVFFLADPGWGRSGLPYFELLLPRKHSLP